MGIYFLTHMNKVVKCMGKCGTVLSLKTYMTFLECIHLLKRSVDIQQLNLLKGTHCFKVE